MARTLVTAALMIGLFTSSGCCWWSERWCPHCQPVAVQGYPVGYAAPACGCPTASYAPPAPPPNWTAPQPQPVTHPGCTCTCPGQ